MIIVENFATEAPINSTKFKKQHSQCDNKLESCQLDNV